MRTVKNINEGWKFIADDVGYKAAVSADGVTVNVPHTWNANDGQDGGNDYKRMACWYVKTIERPKGDCVYLEFRGVNSTADVYVNGVAVAHHDGGYSTFRANVTGITGEELTIAVRADNTPNETVYPQTADFTFYGGIYRDVYVITVPSDHFDLDYYGGPGIMVTPTVEGTTGVAEVRTFVTGSGDVKVTVSDADGRKVAEGSDKAPLLVPDVRLWNGRIDPYLYTVKAELISGGKTVDEISVRIGFRTFSVDPKRGFVLNGKDYPLRGVCRHQDRLGMGNALTRKEHKEDMEMIEEIGATTIRLAHYQHDEYFLDLCDEAGMCCWAEIPYISRHMEGADANALDQMRELIVQQYNHPAIFTWGISNEITMKKAGADRYEFHKKLNAFCHELDPSRPTVIANFVMCGIHNKISHITDMASFNLYYGWYAPFTFLTGVVLNGFHRWYKKTPVGLSEYGAECMPHLHSAHPHRGDSTEEYQVLYHERILHILEKRPWVWASHVWNMYDFGSDGRDHGGDPGKNHKGLVTFDRKTKKDAFYLYKAHWSKEPFVHIAGKRYVNRAESVTTVRVFSNAGEVRLECNGKPVKCSKTDGRDYVFKVRTDVGKNELVATCGTLKDSCVINKTSAPDPSYKLHVKSNNHSWEKKK